MLHYPAGGADYDGALMMASYILFHLLRVMGWTWLWECDSQNSPANHCPDGDMEDTGVGSWTAIGGATLSKDSVSKHQGFYSLKVISAALNDGVRSAALTNMENTVVYRLAIWASNNSGAAWNVDVDTGTGSFTNVGTIPQNGGTWTLYHFTFTTNAGGTRYVRVVDNNATTGTIYVDDINVFRSWFEYNGLDQSGSDGDVQNGNEFSSAGYSFVGGDVGKLLIFYDPVNLGNTGAYLISSISGTNAVLTIRGGGAETLINTAVGTLAWRLLDLTAAPTTAYESTSASGAGWGLESPHASQWRVFFRHRASSGSTTKYIVTWSAPGPSDFSVMTGDFYVYEASTFRPRGSTYNWASPGDGWYITGHGGDTASTLCRLYVMVASGGEFFTFGTRMIPETNSAMALFGVTGVDSLHTVRESYVHLAVRNAQSDTMEIAWSQFPYNGACGTDVEDMPPAAFGLANTGDEAPLQDADARANPFSGDEFLERLLVLRDFDGDYGFYSEKEFDVEDALWGCRSNIGDWTAFSPITGTNNAFSLSGSTITLTSNEALFTPEMVGRLITIAGATTPGNDGTFVITSRISATQVTYENAGGATEAGAGTWSTSPQYFHFTNGFCWKWPGHTAVA